MGDSSAQENHPSGNDIGSGKAGGYACKNGTKQSLDNKFILKNTNVLRVAGPGWFILAMALDISKAAAPVGLAYQIFGWRGWPMALIAMAPPLGHAFSPFLGGKGGKAIAPVFGAMIGLTIWTTPLVAVASVVLYLRLLRPNGWAVVLALLTVLVYLLAFRPDLLLIAVTIGQLALLAYTHRADLTHRPALRRRQK